MYKNLRQYISLLEKEGELVRVTEFVDNRLEMAEITDRVSSQPDGGKAILFENNPTAFPVLTNMFGSDKRIAMALGVDSAYDFTKKLDTFIGTAMSPKKSLSDKLKMLPILSSVSRWMPRQIKGRGECQQVVMMNDTIDLHKIPVLTCAPYDGGAFVTLPLVHTIDPHTGARNVGMYRMQIFSRNTTGLHWHKHKTGERHYNAYKSLGKRMPVTVVLGGDPSYTYSATAPLPDGIDEYMLAGFIRQKGVQLVKCLTNDHYVPSDADFVIEGYVDTSEDKVIEGPFADHTGFYSLEDYYPLFHVTCVTHRKDAVYPATLVGIPPKEDAYISKATESIFLSPIKAVMQPEVRDMWLPQEGVAHNIALIGIEKSYCGQGVKVASALLGAGQMMFSKFMIITSGLDGKLQDKNSWKQIIGNITVNRDIIISKGPMDVLDHTSPQIGIGGKMMIDATDKTIENEADNGCDCALSLPKEYILTSDITAANDNLAKDGFSVIFVKMSRCTIDFKQALTYFLTHNQIKGVKFVVAMDECVDLIQYKTLLWLVGGNVDAARDTAMVSETLLIDARAKFGGVNGFSRAWPNVITMSNNIIESIDGKWSKLGLGDFIESPTLKYRNLIFKGGAAVEQ